MQGFLHWLRRSAAEVKREQDVAADAVRIMTVHGAKGLQAPLVILPDTTALPPEEGGLLWANDPASRRAVPIFSPRRELRCAAAQSLRDAASARRMEEHNRLLYVALTRAEDRLVICGWQTARTMADSCWYRLVERGFERLATQHPVERFPFADWGDAQRHHTPQLAPPGKTADSGASARIDPLPEWAGQAPDWRPTPPPAEPGRPEPLAPSRPEGVELGEVPAAASPLAERAGGVDRFHRGQIVHALLQHLPALPPAIRPAAARAWLDRPGHNFSPGEAVELADEVLAILAHPELAPLFGPSSRAEVPLTGLIGASVVGGLVDRLAVLDDRVLLADYKTNRRPPATEADTPVLYLRQLAAYRAVLRQIFPDRPVQCALIWTQAARVSILPDALLDLHAPQGKWGCMRGRMRLDPPARPPTSRPPCHPEAPMSENTKPVTDETFATDVLQADGPVLVDFWAEWCGPCKMIGPALEEIAGELAGKLTVAKVNIDDNPMTPNAYAVRGIPTLILFKDGKPAATQVGAMPKSRLRDWVTSNL